MSIHETRPSGLSSVRFGDEDLSGKINKPPIELVNDRKGLEEQFKLHGRHGFQIDGVPGIISVPIRLMEEVVISPRQHKGSHAQYYIDGAILEDGSAIFLYTLDENKTSSKHHHKDPLSEDNFVLHGTVDISGTEVSDHYHAPSYSDHQVTARSERVLFVARLNNAALLPREEWHIPIK